jgi:two-component system OmpR family response regulator
MSIKISEPRHQSILDSVSYPVRERIRALLIDDDAADTSLIERLSTRSKQLDIAVTSCRSTDEARSALSRETFDVIYVDYWMGADTSIGFIRDFSQTSDVPCVMLTTLDEPDIRRVAFRAGAEAFLSKNDISTQAIEGVTLTVLHQRLEL